MRVVIPQIAWHARDPILTLDLDPKGKTEQGYYRLVTGGADKLLLIWHLSNPESIKPEITCVAELTRHQKGINVCRFSPCGTYIAAGDDDAYILLWKNESVSDREEVWNMEKVFRRHVEDVTDLSWSSDGNFLISASVDNTAVLWDVKNGTALQFWSEREHTGFVQGVAYDPLGEFSATMCIDRSLRFFNNKTGKIAHKALKYPPAWLGLGSTDTNDEDDTKENKAETKSCVKVDQDQTSAKPKGNESNMDAPAIPPPVLGDAVSEIPMDTSPVVGAKTTSELPLQSVQLTLEGDPPTVEGEAPLPGAAEGEDQKPAQPKNKIVTTLNRLFHDDSLKTFCRRLSCSPRGEFMIVPGGLLPPVEKKKDSSRQGTPVNCENQEEENSKDSSEKLSKKADADQNNAAIIFCRNSWTNPCAVVPTGESYSIAARFNPCYYERDRKAYSYDSDFVNSTKRHERIMSCIGKLKPPKKEQGILLDMPYRLVYALATNDSILIGDTGSAEPLACIKNIHCTRLTDISWSSDGLLLIASSTDGYCSILTFEKGELGNQFEVGDESDFPSLTPTCFPIAPPSPKPVKKKEPKEPKQKKEPKEKKEKKEKPEPKAKKEKKEKVSTPAENKDDKKSKQQSIKDLIMKSGSPAVVSRTNSPKPEIPTDKAKSGSSQVKQSASPDTPSVTNSPAVSTPKPTMLDAWIKGSPKSSGDSQSKPPRRIQPTLLKPEPKPTTSNAASPSDLQSKPPRRIQPTLVKSGPEPTPTSSNAASPGDSQSKQPRRIQPTLVTSEPKSTSNAASSSSGSSSNVFI